MKIHRRFFHLYDYAIITDIILLLIVSKKKSIRPIFEKSQKYDNQENMTYQEKSSVIK